MKLLLGCLFLCILPQVLHTNTAGRTNGDAIVSFPTGNNKTHKAACNGNGDCLNNLECLPNGENGEDVCSCEENEIWVPPFCRAKYNTDCKTNTHCESNTKCSDDLCKCEGHQIWIRKYKICENHEKFDVSVSQNYKIEMNDHLGNHVQNYLNLEMIYKLYASFFSRADVSLPGFSKYFKDQSAHMRDQAVALTKYINMRGGMVAFQPLVQLDNNRICNHILLKTIKDEDTPLKPHKIRPHIMGSEKRIPRSKICSFVTDQPAKKEEVPNIDKVLSRTNLKNGKYKIIDGDEKLGLGGLEDALAFERFIMKKIIAMINHAKGYDDPVTKHQMEEFLMVERPSAVMKLIARLRQPGDYTLQEYEMDIEFAE